MKKYVYIYHVYYARVTWVTGGCITTQGKLYSVCYHGYMSPGNIY